MYLGLADLEIRQGEYDAAMDILEDGLEKASDDAEIKDKIAEMENGEVYDSRINEFDAAGHITRSNHYDSDGNLDDYYIYEYDADGNRTRQSRYLADGTLGAYHIYEYDENGKCIRDNSYQGDGTLREYVLYQYDENGKRISEQRTKVGE